MLNLCFHTLLGYTFLQGTVLAVLVLMQIQAQSLAHSRCFFNSDFEFVGKGTVYISVPSQLIGNNVNAGEICGCGMQLLYDAIGLYS